MKLIASFESTSSGVSWEITNIPQNDGDLLVVFSGKATSNVLYFNDGTPSTNNLVYYFRRTGSPGLIGSASSNTAFRDSGNLTINSDYAMQFVYIKNYAQTGTKVMYSVDSATFFQHGSLISVSTAPITSISHTQTSDTYPGVYLYSLN